MRLSMSKKRIIDGIEYYGISELSEISDVPIRTLNRWLSDGELVNFITIYRTPKGMRYFKLGLPEDDDELVEDSTIMYKFKAEEK